MPPSSQTLAAANAARANALAERSAALLAVGAGQATIWQIIDRARDHAPLGRIRLRQLLLAQDAWAPAKANAVLRRTVRTVAATRSEHRRLVALASRLTIDWLIDRRTSGRRLLAFTDAMADSTLWPGFPFTPRPTEGQEVEELWLTAS